MTAPVRWMGLVCYHFRTAVSSAKCFKKAYVSLLMLRETQCKWTHVKKKKKKIECDLPKEISGFVDFVFSWNKRRPCWASCLFMRRCDKPPKCFFLWNTQNARQPSGLFLAFGLQFACQPVHHHFPLSLKGFIMLNYDVFR